MGLIDYHEQHRYAFELLGLPVNRSSEIGGPSNGTGARARATYVKDISDVFKNVCNSVRVGGKVIVVAADKFNLYRDILDIPQLKLDRILQRDVNRRTGRRNGKFSESIFICTRH